MQRLKLEQNSDLVKRSISGTVTVKYEWTPWPSMARHEEEGPATGRRPSLEGWDFELHGKLKLSIVCAEKLVNLDFTKRNGASSPFCIVLCYPQSPGNGELRPHVWRTPTCFNSLNPRWDATRSFEFCWNKSKFGMGLCPLQQTWSDATTSDGPDAAARSQTFSNNTGGKMDEVLTLMHRLSTELLQVREEVRTLASRVDHIAADVSQVPNMLQNQRRAEAGNVVRAVASPHDGGGANVLLPNWVPASE